MSRPGGRRPQRTAPVARTATVESRCRRADRRGEFEHDGIVVEKWIFTSEPGSRVPAVLYRPKEADAPMPALVLTFGHGGSKSQWQYNYAGQVFAKMGRGWGHP
jgi:cephalosporin-C deacetylase-like acetyl esterase